MMAQNGEGRLLNNRYQLLERFGSGGMANVYRARDILLDRYVAIKVLRDDRTRDAEFDEQFRHEARAVANLTHPNLVTVFDFGFDNGQPFIVMELVPGTDLKSLLQKRGRFTVDEAIPLIVQACAGIGYAHRAGIVHCDVKPHNMLVTPDSRLKVTDFGIARVLSTIIQSEMSDVVWGSPQYFSPEQAAGHAPSPASDVYSLGIVLYEMLTGTLPFTASTAEELARLHVNADPMPPSEYVPDIPRPLEEIILKVLSKEPSARYRTADQLGRVLMNFGNPSFDPTPSVPISTPRSTPRSIPRSTPIPVYNWEPTPPPALETDSTSLDLDWLSVILGLVMVIVVLGLVPFWTWIYYIYNPPIK